MTILSAVVGGKAVADNQQQELSREGQVSLLDGSLRLGYPVSTLSVNIQVQVHPPLGGLSQRWLTQESAIFNNLPPVIKLGDERDLGDITSAPYRYRRMDGREMSTYMPRTLTCSSGACLAGATRLPICDRRVAT